MRLVSVEPDDKYMHLDKQQFGCSCGDVRIYSVLKAGERLEGSQSALAHSRSKASVVLKGGPCLTR
jgi:hypothetical protein